MKETTPRCRGAALREMPALHRRSGRNVCVLDHERPVEPGPPENLLDGEKKGQNDLTNRSDPCFSFH